MFVFLTTLHKRAFTLTWQYCSFVEFIKPLYSSYEHTTGSCMESVCNLGVCVVTYLNVVSTTGSVLIGKVSYSSFFIVTLYKFIIIMQRENE